MHVSLPSPIVFSTAFTPAAPAHAHACTRRLPFPPPPGQVGTVSAAYNTQLVLLAVGITTGVCVCMCVLKSTRKT